MPLGVMLKKVARRPAKNAALVWDGTAPDWQAITGALLSGFTAGLVVFGAADGSLATAAGFSYNSGTGAFAVPGAASIGGAVSVTPAGLTANPLIVIGKTGAGSTEVNQAVRIGNVGAANKYLALGYDSTNDYGYIAGIQTATGWLALAINPYGNATLALNGGGGATTIGGTLGVTNVTDASDSATAAVVTAGGVAMAKNLWVGANAAVGIALTLNCAAANGGLVKYTAANVLRWQHGRVGSTHDWRLEGYDSSGNLTDIPLTVANAAGGDITLASGRPLKLGNAYVATPQVCTGYVTIKDSSGTTYKVLVAT